MAVPFLATAPGGLSPVWAQAPSAEEAKERAGQTPATREAVARARQAAQAGRGDEATSVLENAYQASGDPALLFELGELHEKAGRSVEAKRVFEAYLKRAPNGPVRAAAERHLREIELGKHDGTKAGAAPAPSPPAPAPVAPVSVPAAPAAATPAPTGKGPEATPPVLGPAPSPPTIVPRESAHPDARPQPAPAATAAPSAPLSPPPLVLSTPVPAETTATLAARLTESSESQDDLPLPRWIPWSGAVVTAGLLTGAILTGLSAGKRYDDLKSSCGTTVAGCGSSEIDEVRSKARTANILWGAAALVGVATGVAVYVDARAGGVSKLWSF